LHLLKAAAVAAAQKQDSKPVLPLKPASPIPAGEPEAVALLARRGMEPIPDSDYTAGEWEAVALPQDSWRVFPARPGYMNPDAGTEASAEV